jgi:hypothetical protein
MFFNIISWILVMVGVFGVALITGIVVWLMIEEINK